MRWGPGASFLALGGPGPRRNPLALEAPEARRNLLALEGPGASWNPLGLEGPGASRNLRALEAFRASRNLPASLPQPPLRHHPHVFVLSPSPCTLPCLLLLLLPAPCPFLCPCLTVKSFNTTTPLQHKKHHRLAQTPTMYSEGLSTTALRLSPP